MFDKPVVIIFYINLGLVLCAIIHAAAVAWLCKKTAYRLEIGLTMIFLTVFGFIGFVAQLVMYALENVYTPYAVYAAAGLLAVCFIMSGVYCGLLGRRSNRHRCRLAAITACLPPIGTAFIVRLSYKMQRDTLAQNLVFTGYAYTMAAFGAFLVETEPRYVDSAGEEEFEPMSQRDALRHIKQLKKAAKTDEGLYKYAEAIAYYTPVDIKLAVSAMNKAAKHDYAPALFNLGYWHETGTYFNKDLKKAIEYYARAAELGDKDAELRLAIADIKTGKTDEGLTKLRARADAGDYCALYDLAACAESGIDAGADMDKAIDMYATCAKRNMLVAQQRLFALVARSVNTAEYDAVFKKISGYEFDGDFGLVMRAVTAVKEKRASDAAALFLDAVRLRGKWEGDARLFVGTLYMDCGKLDTDRRNGAAYVKSAVDMSAVARDMYAALPKELTSDKYRPKKIK